MIGLRVSSKEHTRGNGATEKTVSIAKQTIIKRLQGKAAEWDMFVGSTQLAMNCRHAKIHSSRPFSVMLGRKPNGFQEYSGVQRNVMVKNTARAAKTDPRYVGPCTVYGLTKGDSYALPDITRELLARNVSPSHIKAISPDTTVQSENTYCSVGTNTQNIHFEWGEATARS